MGETLQQLNDHLFTAFQKESLVLLGTIDSENGSPSVGAISWIIAPDHTHMRFAVDNRSRIVANVKKNEYVTVTTFANNTVFTIYGRAQVLVDELAEVPLKLACVQINVETVRDAMFYGSRISVEPEYEKTYDKRAAEKLDGQVFAAMKKA